MKEWNRVRLIYTKGIEEFIKLASLNDVEWLSMLLCPCVKCWNRERSLENYSCKTYLVRHGIDQMYTLWALHGENSSLD